MNIDQEIEPSIQALTNTLPQPVEVLCVGEDISREEWLRKRMAMTCDKIEEREAMSACGVPRAKESPYSLYWRKQGKVPEAMSESELKIGLAEELVIKEAAQWHYQEKLRESGEIGMDQEVKVDNCRVTLEDKDNPGMVASIDGIITKPNGATVALVVQPMQRGQIEKELGECTWLFGLPESLYYQAQHVMAVTGLEECAMSVMALDSERSTGRVGQEMGSKPVRWDKLYDVAHVDSVTQDGAKVQGQMRTFRIFRDEEIVSILRKNVAFYVSEYLRGENRPKVDSHPATEAALFAMVDREKEFTGGVNDVWRFTDRIRETKERYDIVRHILKQDEFYLKKEIGGYQGIQDIISWSTKEEWNVLIESLKTEYPEIAKRVIKTIRKPRLLVKGQPYAEIEREKREKDEETEKWRKGCGKPEPACQFPSIYLKKTLSTIDCYLHLQCDHSRLDLLAEDITRVRNELLEYMVMHGCCDWVCNVVDQTVEQVDMGLLFAEYPHVAQKVVVRQEKRVFELAPAVRDSLDSQNH